MILSPQQKKKVESLAKFLKNKDVETFNHLFSIEEKIDFLYITLIANQKSTEKSISDIKIPKPLDFGDKLDAILKKMEIPEDDIELSTMKIKVNAQELKKKLNIKDGQNGKDGNPGKDGKPGSKGDQGNTGPKGERGNDAPSVDIETISTEIYTRLNGGLNEKLAQIETHFIKTYFQPAEIRNQIEKLEGDDRLDISAIRGLEDYDEISALARERITQTIVSGGGARLFTQLNDVPNSYTGHAGDAVVVNSTGTGLVFSSTSGVVSSVSNSDGTLTISPTAGNVVASLNLSHANTWLAQQNIGPYISLNLDGSATFGNPAIEGAAGFANDGQLYAPYAIFANGSAFIQDDGHASFSNGNLTIDVSGIVSNFNSDLLLQGGGGGIILDTTNNDAPIQINPGASGLEIDIDGSGTTFNGQVDFTQATQFDGVANFSAQINANSGVYANTIVLNGSTLYFDGGSGNSVESDGGNGLTWNTGGSIGTWGFPNGIIFGGGSDSLGFFGTSLAPQQNGDITAALQAYGLVFGGTIDATNFTGTLPITRGGTGTVTAAAAFKVLSPMTTLGDIIFESTGPNPARLAGNTTTAKKFLTQTGTGSVSAAPVWTDLFGGANTFTADQTFNANIKLGTAGNGLYIKEGSNATMGIATLSGGTVTVSTTKVTASSRIFLCIDGGTITNVGATYISARTAGTSFTISSTNILDASNVSWVLIEPA